MVAVCKSESHLLDQCTATMLSHLVDFGGAGPPWVLLQHWLQAISLESEAFEIRALSAPILEGMWHEMMMQHGVFGTIGFVQVRAQQPLKAAAGFAQEKMPKATV
eukprot:SAG31_NODE_2640_length_5324_cov_5.437835_5_plen_105_part_00